MKKLIALVLTLALALSLCACDANNDLSQEKLQGTWSVTLTMNELLAFSHQAVAASVGFGDLSGLVGSLQADYTLTFLLVFDEQGAAAYLDKEVFNLRMQEFSQYLMQKEILLNVLGLQNATDEQISTALGGLDIERLIQILEVQFLSADFATNMAQSCNYGLTDEYVVIPVADSYTIDGSKLMLNDGYLEYNGAELLLTENEHLTTIGFNLKTAPLTFHRVSDKTDY